MVKRLKYRFVDLNSNFQVNPVTSFTSFCFCWKNLKKEKDFVFKKSLIRYNWEFFINQVSRNYKTITSCNTCNTTQIIINNIYIIIYLGLK